MIEGLKYLSNFISKEQEAELLSTIDSFSWSNELKRRTQHYGYKYDYSKKKIDDQMYLGPLPSWLKVYTERLIQDNFFLEEPDQVIINEYLPGQGIGRHIDCITCFTNTVASLSLGSTCAMDFENQKDGKKGTMILAPLSLLVLQGQSRYDWLHSIPARKEDVMNKESLVRSRRVSLTFRKILK